MSAYTTILNLLKKIMPGDKNDTFNIQTMLNDNWDKIDAAVGLKNGNADVRVATTANITLSGLQTIDGVAVAVNDRVLVKNQTTASQNGPYVVQSTAWTRSADADTSAKIASGISVFVKEGTVNQKTEWRMTNTGVVTLGTTALTFQVPSQPGMASLASPAFTGVPTAPTATLGTNTTQLSTTAFVQAALAALVNSSPAALDTLNELAAALGNDANFTTTMTNALALKAPLASPTFTGVPAVPTAAGGTNTTQAASTAFVEAVRVALAAADALKAPLASPTFTGVPAVPTAAGGTNTTQAASTAFVEAIRVALVATDALKAPLASPAFTGTPTAPTASPGTNTTQIATSAFVQAAIAAVVNSSPAALDTLNELAAALGNDANFATTMMNAIALKAPLASPTFTGAVTLPGDPSSSLHAATKSYVDSKTVPAATVSALGTVQAAAVPAAGNPVAPIRTAIANDVQITSTSAQTIATFTPTAKGNFLLPIYFRVVTGTTNVTIVVTYADSSGAQTTTMIPAQALSVGSYSLVPLFINAVSGTAINVIVTTSVANQVYATASIMGV